MDHKEFCECVDELEAFERKCMQLAFQIEGSQTLLKGLQHDHQVSVNYRDGLRSLLQSVLDEETVSA